MYVPENIDHVETLELNITRMDAPILSECINSLNQFRTLKRHKDKFEVITENRKTSVKFSAENSVVQSLSLVFLEPSLVSEIGLFNFIVLPSHLSWFRVPQSLHVSIGL
ncbi:hypothetical protein CHARACLAT_029535 [Characodon lateralis]|uniref:Uncharacterized protein n=1 Tax=Characodon lateralis TaxID=208331 RepID=A0ABU7ENC9_9TELE|nr:hypothetical protein [Characodon lateralis]